MKIIQKVLWLAFGAVFLAQPVWSSALSDSTGLPGDHFSLETALAIFKESASPADFEKRINSSSDQGVNNLDLNQDGKVDFLKVTTGGNGDDRMLIISAVVSKEESQDVAVIEISRQGGEKALLQIVGDADLYGNSKVVEPFEEGVKEDDGHGPMVMPTMGSDIWVNVWFWPCVTYFYGPGYVVYVSTWYWDYYPEWWMPWPPYPYLVFYGYGAPYHHHYHHVYVHRTAHIHQSMYMPRRSTSQQVVRRFEKPVMQYRQKNPIHREDPMPSPRTKPSPRVTPQDRDRKHEIDRKNPPQQRPLNRPPATKPTPRNNPR
jgi:hypothetical protein